MDLPQGAGSMLDGQGKGLPVGAVDKGEAGAVGWRMKKSWILLMAITSALWVGGCSSLDDGGGTGPGTAYFQNAELKDTLYFSMESVHVATVAGLQDLECILLSDIKDANHAAIIARTDKDTKVDITLLNQSLNQTGIRIRAGTAGDEQLSREILGKIRAHL
jgi:hypothetical protein